MREHVFTIHSYNTYSLCILSTRLHAICQGHNPVSMELTINQRRQAFNQNSYTLSIVIIEVQGVLPPLFFWPPYMNTHLEIRKDLEKENEV